MTAEQVTAPATEAGDDILVSVRGLKVHFPIYGGTILSRQVGATKAVDGVDLDIPRGKTVGLVGESGCGKSTLGRAILRLTPITEGVVKVGGVDYKILKESEILAKLEA